MKTKKLCELLDAYRVYDRLLIAYRGLFRSVEYERKFDGKTIRIKSIDQLKSLIIDEFDEIEQMYKSGSLSDGEKKDFENCFEEWYNTTYEETLEEEK